MHNAQILADRYIASWNETDADTRRGLISELWAEEGRYIDPMMRADGQDGIAALIGGVHAQFPSHRFTLTGPADGHDHFVRFSWSLGTAGGPVVARGTDFAAVSEDGRLVQVTGFLDPA